MLIYFLIGAAIGAVTGIPIGPVNVAVIDAAYRHTLRRAVAVGLGGAIADGLYAGLGIVGIGPLLDDHPAIPPILYAASGLVLVIYGGMTVRSQPVNAVTATSTKAPNPSTEMWSGFWLGMALICLNPAALVTWVLIVGTYLSGLPLYFGLAATLGVTCGSTLWFLFVAYLSNHGMKVLGEKAIWVTRVVGLLLVGYGLFSIGRAIKYWFL